MNLSQVSTQLLAAKRQKNITFGDIGQKLGRDEVWVAALFYGQASCSDDKECAKLLEILDVKLSS
jgi:cyanate lyase